MIIVRSERRLPPTKGIAEYPRMGPGSSLDGYYKYGVCLDTSQLNLGILLGVYFHCTYCVDLV